MPTNIELAAQIAALQEQIADIEAQLAKLFSLHGLSWGAIERQRRREEAL